MVLIYSHELFCDREQRVKGKGGGEGEIEQGRRERRADTKHTVIIDRMLNKN